MNLTLQDKLRIKLGIILALLLLQSIIIKAYVFDNVIDIIKSVWGPLYIATLVYFAFSKLYESLAWAIEITCNSIAPNFILYIVPLILAIIGNSFSKMNPYLSIFFFLFSISLAEPITRSYIKDERHTLNLFISYFIYYCFALFKNNIHIATYLSIVALIMILQEKRVYRDYAKVFSTHKTRYYTTTDTGIACCILMLLANVLPRFKPTLMLSYPINFNRSLFCNRMFGRVLEISNNEILQVGNIALGLFCASIVFILFCQTDIAFTLRCRHDRLFLGAWLYMLFRIFCAIIYNSIFTSIDSLNTTYYFFYSFWDYIAAAILLTPVPNKSSISQNEMCRLINLPSNSINDLALTLYFTGKRHYSGWSLVNSYKKFFKKDKDDFDVLIQILKT